MNRLKELRQQRGWTQEDLGKRLKVQKSAISKYEVGRSSLSDELIKQLCEIFGVTADYLLCRSDISENSVKTAPAFTKKDERDIAKDLETLLESLESGSDLMFDGNPLSEEAKSSIMSAMQLGLEAAKAKNKERFTPKKYRKD